jgi:hypothetical protein
MNLGHIIVRAARVERRAGAVRGISRLETAARSRRAASRAVFPTSGSRYRAVASRC